ncbi:response regulator [Luteibacter sp. RCC_6_2]|uniref:response regulator n=1 Tax=Luteibacter sp. RCC_6_2 TaxID=3239223 RepID=UPI0035240499
MEDVINIIVVEGDPALGAAMARVLGQMTYTVTWLRCGAELLEALRLRHVDLALFDVDMAPDHGLDILRQVRRLGIRTPLLAMTACEVVETRIAILDAGADDCLAKPFDLDELTARVRCLARRARGFADNLIELGDLSMNLCSLEVTYAGRRIELTRREFSLLQMLVERAGRIVRREVIETSIYGCDAEVGPNALEVLVHGLRRKVGPGAIRTVRGFGYMAPL